VTIYYLFSRQLYSTKPLLSPLGLEKRHRVWVLTEKMASESPFRMQFVPNVLRAVVVRVLVRLQYLRLALLFQCVSRWLTVGGGTFLKFSSRLPKLLLCIGRRYGWRFDSSQSLGYQLFSLGSM
jgi:hypothetical protein